MNAAELNNISKQFPGRLKKANDNISLDLRKGEILCIAGENGAGKTTLMKILMGLEKQDSGTVKKNGHLGMVHQHFMLFPEFSAAENIVMGIEPKKYGIFFDNKKAFNLANEIIKENNFSINANTPVKDLTLGEMQQVEICRILYHNADIIIMDEPTSILTENESQSLFKTLKKLSKSGKSIILITHKLHEIKEISDRVAVLRKGELVGVKNTEEIDLHEISRMMIGEGINFYSRDFSQSTENKKPVIEFKNVTVLRKEQKRPLLDNVSFSVHAGEILGFAGVGGNGLGVIEAVLGGFLHPASGKIYHNGNDISNLSIRKLRNQGLAYVPADRKRVGSAVDATIEENLKITGASLSLLEKYNIDVPSLNAKAMTLSGGNLQKLILAREISSIKDYIVFSEPTWGLDAASSQFIIKEIENLRRQDKAIILISTNLDDIIALCGRIVVMYKGKIACTLDNNGDREVKGIVGEYMQGLNNEK